MGCFLSAAESAASCSKEETRGDAQTRASMDEGSNSYGPSNSYHNSNGSNNRTDMDASGLGVEIDSTHVQVEAVEEDVTDATARSKEQSSEVTPCMKFIPDAVLASMLEFLPLAHAILASSSCRFLLSASCSPQFCASFRLTFQKSDCDTDDDNSDSSSSSDSDGDDQLYSGEARPPNWQSVSAFLARRKGVIQSLSIWPPEGFGVTVLQASHLVKNSGCTEFNISRGPWTEADNFLCNLAKEASRIRACQRSYDSEYDHEWGMSVSDNVDFLKDPPVSEADFLLKNIRMAYTSYMHCIRQLGCAQNPEDAKLGEWLEARNYDLEVFRRFNLLNFSIAQSLEIRTKEARLGQQTLSSLLRRWKQLLQNHQKDPWTFSYGEDVLVGILAEIMRRFPDLKTFYHSSIRGPTPTYRFPESFFIFYDLTRKHVLIPMCQRMIEDLARLEEFLISLQSSGSRQDGQDELLEHFGSFGGMLFKSFRDPQSSLDADADDEVSPSLGNGTIGLALSALHRDPGAFKSFCQLGRHLSDVTRLD